MKKITAILMSMLLVFSLAACGTSSDGGSSDSTNSPATTPAASSAPAGDTDGAASDDGGAAETSGTASKTLVVYYSASGNTERVAKSIAAAVNADIFEIVPESVYTDDDLDWTNKSSRVSREHDDESLRDVPLTTTDVANWADYDTVIIGYPIWWDIAAWPIDNFVKANDFTGKTVIPFCTSSSSGIGQSGKLLAELAGSGDWQEGQRFSGGSSDSAVSDWVGTLNLD